VFTDDEMKIDAEKKLKPKRPRKVIKKSHMEDSYPVYLQVCVCDIYTIGHWYKTFCQESLNVVLKLLRPVHSSN